MEGSGESSVEASAAAEEATSSVPSPVDAGGAPSEMSPSADDKPPAPPDDSEPSLLQSMTEVMALSYLCFMYADVRALSSQGRISTRFEHIAVESDYSPRFEAGFIAGDQASGTGRASGPKHRKCGGVSTAQIMAVMLLEIERATSKRRNKDLNPSERGDMGGDGNSAEKRRYQEKMNKLLESYSRIIGADLVKGNDRVGMVSKSVRDLASSTLTPPGADELLEDEAEPQRPPIPKFQDVVRMIREKAHMEPNAEADGGGADDADGGGSAPQATRDDATDATVRASNTSGGAGRPRASNATGRAGRRGSVLRAAHTRAELMGMMTGQEASLNLRKLIKEDSREFYWQEINISAPKLHM